MQIAICGKSNTGKSTFFSSATLVDAEISNRIFTTIKPNMGVSYVRTECPCKSLNLVCSPNNSKCIDGFRFIPIKLIDIAGLVPGAHEGRGLGNQFLTDIMEANALIHIVDIAGSTDQDGNPVSPGSNDPKQDIVFLEQEIEYWMLGILEKAWNNIIRRSQHEKIEDLIYKQLSGLMVSQNKVEELVKKHNISANSSKDNLLKLVRDVRKENKPILIAGNKIDIPGADEIYQRVNKETSVIPCSADTELALRRAAEKSLIKYMPGDSDFEILNADEKQRQALEFMKENVLKKYSSTGVQKIINEAVFSLLDMIVVYSVENEHKFSDKKGNILPDAHLMKKGSTPVDLAFRIHADIGNNFVAAIDARKGTKVSADYELKNNDIISIRAANR